MPALVSLFKNICFRASRYNERVFDKMSGPVLHDTASLFYNVIKRKSLHVPSQVTMRSLPLLHAVTSHCPFHVQSSHDGHLMENVFFNRNWWFWTSSSINIYRHYI